MVDVLKWLKYKALDFDTSKAILMKEFQNGN